MREPGAPVGRLDMRARRPARASRTSSARCARRAWTRRTELVPVAPGRALRDGRDRRPTSTARTTRPGPLRRRRVRVHGPARRQPARLELAERVLRLRRRARPRAALERARRRRAGDPPPAPPLPIADAARRARACGATPASCATRDGLRARSLDDPHPLARLDRALRARCARRAAARTPRATSPTRDPALDLHHAVIRGRRRAAVLRALGLNRFQPDRQFQRTSAFVNANSTSRCVPAFTRRRQYSRRRTGSHRRRGAGSGSCTSSAGRSTESCRDIDDRRRTAAATRARAQACEATIERLVARPPLLRPASAHAVQRHPAVLPDAAPAARVAHRPALRRRCATR